MLVEIRLLRKRLSCEVRVLQKGPRPVGFEEYGLLTLDDVAAILHCSKAHIANVVAGRVPGCPAIPAVRLGRRRLVRRASLEAWIAANDRIADKILPSPERVRRSA